MKNTRIPLFIALGVAILGVVLGSFFDLQISSAIASPNNNFAILVSAIGPTIGFGAVAVMGGGLIALAVKGKYHIIIKILCFVLAACCLGVAIYYPGREYFGVNGFYKAAPDIVGYLIVLPIEGAAMVGGFFLFKDCQNKNMWIIFCTMIALLLIALVAVLPFIKDNMRRPRFRALLLTDMDLFHNWWEPCKNYKDIMAQYGIESSDHFKSFPSGHTAEASILLVTSTFFPLAHDKFRRVQLPLFIGSGIIVFMVAFARILAAAHFLSDVSMGATVIIALTVIANEVIIRVKALHKENQLEEAE